jgi:HPt (histidine-containing phosphotransfer) domain-containing protein
MVRVDSSWAMIAPVIIGRSQGRAVVPKSTRFAADEDDMAINPQSEASAGPEPLLSEFAGDADMAELVEFFVDELKQRVDTMTTAFQSGDHLQLKTMAHQLKGAAGGYGFPTITASAAELEGVLKVEQAELSSIGEKLEALISLCRRAARA